MSQIKMKVAIYRQDLSLFLVVKSSQLRLTNHVIFFNFPFEGGKNCIRDTIWYIMTLLVGFLHIDANFDGGQIVAYVDDTRVREASGITASKQHSGILYTLNDSGGTNQ